MKILIPTLIAVATASDVVMKVFNNEARKKINETDSMDRSTQSVTYGCWCFFEEMPIMTGQKKPFRPKGKPVDTLDGYCKQLTEAYECISQEYIFDKNGDICDPRFADSGLKDDSWWIDINYNLYGDKLTNSELKTACLNLNGGMDTCEVYTCMVEATFLMRFWDKSEHFLNDDDFNKYGMAWDTYGENVDYNGQFYDYDIHTFDPNIECVTTATGGGEKSCCGDYPNRALFRPNGGAVECCAGKTYSPTFHSCCKDVNGDESIKDFGC